MKITTRLALGTAALAAAAAAVIIPSAAASADTHTTAINSGVCNAFQQGMDPLTCARED